MSIVVYLLHAENQNPTVQQPVTHYVGSARVDQFARRVRDHINGHGSLPTTAKVAIGYAWAVSNIWLSSSRALEYELQREQDKSILCHLCNPELALEQERQLKLKCVGFTTTPRT
jgi:hypothetical protein